MSNLSNQQINSSFSGLLQVPGGITSSLQQVQDGNGNGTGLLLSSTGTNVITSSTFIASVNGVQIPGAVARQISDGFGDIVSAKDFGAVGDYDPVTNTGTDDYAAIQAALNYASASFRFAQVFLPAGRYRVSAGLVVPAGVTLTGLGGGNGYDTANVSGGTSIFADLSVPIVVTLNGGAASISTGIINIFITRRPGSIPSGSVGLKTISSDNVIVDNVLSFRHSIGFYVNGQLNINFFLCNTSQITDTHVLIENTYEVAFTDCRFGRNGGADLSCNHYVTIKTSGDGIKFLRCQFNQSGNAVTGAAVFWDGWSSPTGGILSFTTSYFENYATNFIFQSGVGTGVIQRLEIINSVIYPNDHSYQFLQVLTGYLTELNISSCSLYGPLTLDQQTHSNVSNNFLVGNVTINQGSGCFVGNTLYDGLLVEGTFTNAYSVSTNVLTGSSSFVNTATGNISSVGNITLDSATNANIVNKFNTGFIKLNDVAFAVKTYYGTLDVSGNASLTFANSQLYVLNIQAFYEGNSGEAIPMTVLFADGSGIRLTGGVNGHKYRASVIYSSTADSNW